MNQFFIIIFFVTSTIFSRDIEIISLRSTYPQINYFWDPLTLMGAFSWKNRIVKFQVDANFYISNSRAYFLKKPVSLSSKGVLLLSTEFVEEVLSELRLPVRYRLDQKKLKSEKTKIRKLPSSGKLNYIVIDPGHGGHDPGAISGKILEKKITLNISRYLLHVLRKEFPKAKIYITRYNDQFVSLLKRSKIANNKAQNGQRFGVLLSIHANSTLSKSLNGFEVYYLSQNRGSERERQLQLRENFNSDPNYLKTLQSKLIDAQIQYESKILARKLNAGLSKKLSKLIRSRGVRKADFAVLRGSLMPSVLIEMGYITNSKEVLVLQSSQFRQKFARGLVMGLKQFENYWRY